MQMQTQDSSIHDDVLLRRISQHDTRAFEQFYDRHSPLIYALILRIVRERSLADELLQETFLHVWSKPQEPSEDGFVVTWLYRVAREKCLDALRWLNRDPAQRSAHLAALYHETQNAVAHKGVAPSHARTLAESATGAGPAELGPTGMGVVAAGIHEKVGDFPPTQLHDAIYSLPQEQRVCLELAFFGGMTQQQIAEYIHRPLATVKNSIQSGLETLAQVIGSVRYRGKDLAI
jgi:RNA polymerase sigma-70 factor (ECF subfamily)